ncbi:MAG: hypothetical protein PHV68_00640 [Candidatus Gastranaerophilales bacterium]|nr:hypothetical protein [Candidatus Gastranaerophilales bacterium]
MFKKTFSTFIIAVLLNFTCSQMVYAKKVILENGTKVKLKTTSYVSSGFSREGEDVNFIVEDDVNWGKEILIPSGSVAKGVITEIKKTSLLGRRGKIVIDLDYAIAVDGTKVPLMQTIERQSTSKLDVIPSPVFWILSPFFMIISSEEAEIAENFITNARVDRDIEIEILETENML